MTELPEPLRLANWLEQSAGASSVYRDRAAAELRRMHRELQQLAQTQMQPCAGRNCGSTNPNLHSAECFEDYEKSTGMAQPEQEPVADDIASILACRDMLDAQPVPPRTWVGSGDLEDSNAYLTPPQRKPLSDEQIRRIELTVHGYTRQPLDVKSFARAIEAAHGIKGS